MKISREAGWIWLAVVLFIGVSAWWLTQDTRVMDYDSGAHAIYANAIAHEIPAGQLRAIFTDWNTYPPLVHFVGGIATIIVGGLHPMALILSSNLVFVPLLAFGCFGVGRIAYGTRAGLLAAVLALGSPMFVSMMHEYDLDPPQAALIAVAVWAILSSRRFERTGIAALAGALAGFAMLTKQTSVVFLAGPLLVVLARGGWRNWRGLLAFVIVLGVIAGYWYGYHWQELKAQYGTTGGLAGLPANSIQTPPRSSLRNFAWYGWNLVNEQIMLPFALAFLGGVAVAVWRLVRRRITPENVEPELLGGVLVSYAAMTYLTHKDPRYTLPMLVYVAVLATGWIATLPRPRLRAALSAGVIGLSAIYFFGLSFGIGGAARIALPGAQNNILYQWQLTLYETSGWVRGGPVHDADVPALFAGLHRFGIRGVVVSTGANPIDFNTWGLNVLAVSSDLGYQGNPPHPLGQQGYVTLRAPIPGGPRPCQVMNDGSAIYVVHGPAPGIDPASLQNPTNPRQRYTFICPGRAPVAYP